MDRAVVTRAWLDSGRESDMTKMKKTAVLIALLGLLVAVPVAAGDDLPPTRSETAVDHDRNTASVVKHVAHRERNSPRQHRHEWRHYHGPDHGWHYYRPYRDHYPPHYHYRGYHHGHYDGTPRFGYHEFGYGHGAVRVGPLRIWW